MNKILAKIKSLMPSKRKLIQLYAALLTNANIKGFVSGKIYQGTTKSFCAPGLNCYSCPGAVGACPLGSLQNALYNQNKSMLFYVVGCLMIYGLLFGRFICGFLCPFGFIQELFYKIKTPKLKKNKFTRVLSYLKYVILAFFVIIVPLLYAFKNVNLPAFCKYICPAGTIEGAVLMLFNPSNSGLFGSLGYLFTWKFCLLVSFILASIFIFRFFCRFFCPLGAIYGLFNKFSVFGIKLEKSKCVDCGLCQTKCKMDIKHVADQECINCGECIEVCPTHAISWRGSKIFLPPNEIEGLTPDTDADERIALEAKHKAKIEKIKKRNKILKTVVGCLMTGLLVFAIVYYNFIDVDKKKENEDGDTPGASDNVEIGTDIGNRLYGADIPLMDENGDLGVTFNPAENKGKITVINFWGVWCSSCKEELPYFDAIATEYKDQLTVLAIHSDQDKAKGPQYISDHYPDSDILFGSDFKEDPNNKFSNDYYYSLLDGAGTYPMTVIIDGEGIVRAYIDSSVTYSELKGYIEDILNVPYDVEMGTDIGNRLYGADIPLMDENGDLGVTFNPAENKGKITVINFWGVWCSSCKEELPYFDAIATEYKDQLTVLAIHSDQGKAEGPQYISDNYPDSDILFGSDFKEDPNNKFSNDYYYSLLDGAGTYPMTVIIDGEGIVRAYIDSSVTYSELKGYIEDIING